ncbi:hypothetical protein AgCh_029395 [Apium graveolens]
MSEEILLSLAEKKRTKDFCVKGPTDVENPCGPHPADMVGVLANVAEAQGASVKGCVAIMRRGSDMSRNAVVVKAEEKDMSDITNDYLDTKIDWVLGMEGMTLK